MIESLIGYPLIFGFDKKKFGELSICDIKGLRQQVNINIIDEPGDHSKSYYEWDNYCSRLFNPALYLKFQEKIRNFTLCKYFSLIL